MCSKTLTINSTPNSLDKFRELLDATDSVVIGAGSGLSTSAGLTYSGPRFTENFADFIKKYGYNHMYSAAFHHYESPEEHWAYWSRHIYHNRYAPVSKNTYDVLLNLVGKKDYFVITTNVDHLFQRHGFDKTRLFYTQGDYGLWQCAKPCHDSTYDNHDTVMEMYQAQVDMKVPSHLIPVCPNCGGPLSMNLRADSTFVEDAGWHSALARYQSYLDQQKCKKVLYLDLGIGGNTPSIIKYPFWNLTYQNKQASYVCVNLGEANVPKEIATQSLSFDQDIHDFLTSI